jgi:hypothetical protein
MLLVDSGGQGYSREQILQVFEIYKKIGYSAVGMSTPDIRVGNDFWKLARDNDIPVVHVDITSHGWEKPYIIREVDGVKVGIVSFGSVPEGNDNFELRMKRYSAYSEARKKSDILVLLDQAQVVDAEWIKRNASRLGAPDIVIGGASRMNMVNPEMVGKSMICPTGNQGKTLGLVKIEYVQGQDPKLEFSRVTMSEDIEQDEEIVKMLEQYKAQQMAMMASASRPAASPVPANANYVSSEGCKACHSKEYDSWAKSKHAQALQTLVKESKVIPECLECHSDMFRMTRQLSIAENKPAGVECVSCHARVIPHTTGFKKTGPTQAERDACMTCHVKEHSPDFDLEKYWKKVDHKD